VRNLTVRFSDCTTIDKKVGYETQVKNAIYFLYSSQIAALVINHEFDSWRRLHHLLPKDKDANMQTFPIF
jgi:hypothetical protein